MMSGHTGILVSLLIFFELTSRNTLAINTNQTTLNPFRSWIHHNHHHHHHHQQQEQQHQNSLHQRPRVLHDSLINSNNKNDEHLHKKIESIDLHRDVMTDQFNLTKIIGYTGNRGVSLYDDQKKINGNFIGFPLMTTTTTTTTPSYNKFHPGRRVCTRQIPTSINHHVDHEIRFVYTEVSSSSYICCPGWSQVTRTSYGCNRRVCGPHGKCNCPKGFTGSQCQMDVDECVMEKPCAQICRNLPGSYECQCRYGFHLQPDGQSCRKNNSDGTAFEARDLENDYGITTSTKRPGEIKPHDTENEVSDGELDKDYDVILKRLLKLEKQFARGKKRETETVELTTKVNEAVEGVAELKLAAKNALHFLMETFGPVRQEVYNLKNKYDLEHRRVDYLVQRVAELDNKVSQQKPLGTISG
ncbi:hypothetical protein HCN44_009355 [Aphidius gifuensis]|uniref:EGF-like domain-containing protein n=1 Tax=Aphidius gifuensis TaxID=684658 RepID=A0A834Y747_APHGI|nr:hypothetical protein HCN44_009355 [Aphidius gifuensis]